mmetsp:Transcript_23928/g.59640  ORF Transcript_23928/g.59640 Transcript_23928/m.59640 type:complete len:527 (-) Transcript_23928:102-1682(-)
MAVFRAGDWRCGNCGDHQFEKNLVCRKCAAPKPTVSSNNIVSKAGDWICPNPNCNDVQFEKNAACRKCGTLRPAILTPSVSEFASDRAVGVGVTLSKAAPHVFMHVASGVTLDGTHPTKPVEDWKCKECGDVQNCGLVMCRDCGAPKPTVSSNKQTSKLGDWICPNPMCQDVQFERNLACRRCGMPKPVEVARRHVPDVLAMGMVSDQMQEENWSCHECGIPQAAGCLACSQCGVPKPKVSSNNIVAKKGDWICPNLACRDVQFERNFACRKCGTPKPLGSSRTSMAELQMSSAHLPIGGSSAVVAPEDWMCRECGDHQFARNLACRKCGAPRPKVSSNNISSKLGDWICPNLNCQDVQFERNASCRRCGTPKPPAVTAHAAPRSMPFMFTPHVGILAQGLQPHGHHHGSPMQGYTGGLFADCGLPLSYVSTNKQMLKPGDWICPNHACRDVQFGKNDVCRKCGTSRPMMSSNKQVFKTGDWICPNSACNDVQFEKNRVCRRCGTSRPDNSDGCSAPRMRSRSPAR